MKTVLILTLFAGAVFAAPSTPITRGRLTTDLDAGGHTVTNSNLATTNFVWDVVGAVTNNLPTGGGITTNDVKAIVGEEAYATRINLPPLPADATVGDLVDALNAVAAALRKEEEP